jgi:tetratricopeptide (TPR) repeat protein
VIIGKDFYDPSQVATLTEYLDSEKFDYILIDTSQYPVDLFDPDADLKPLSLYSILTGASPECRENNTDIFGYISVERESLSVVSNLILLGERLYSAGKTVEAMKCFSHVITNSSDNDSRCQAFNNIGVIAHSINQMDRAEQMFISALEIDSVNIHALLNLSDVYLSQGGHDNALAVLKKAAAAHPGNEQISEKIALITPVSNSEEIFENREKQISAELPIHLENTSIYRENLTFSCQTPFIVCAMFAGSTKYQNYADRLALSCEDFDLPYSIYHVPEIHHSMFLKGGSNLSFTKANFIYNCLDRFVAKTIIYLDIDLVIVDKPQLLINNSMEGVDFSIYNWLADSHNEAYMPINGRIDPADDRSSLYTYSHHIAYYSTEQLVCSGATQLWGNTANARKLLRDWQTTIIENYMQADDPCLDIAFNNLGIPINVSWLPKEYIRIPWWPHIKPVILHRDIPATGGERPSEETANRKRLYPDKLQIRTDELIFPKGYVIDTKKQQLKKIKNNTIVDINTIPLDVTFWIHT